MRRRDKRIEIYFNEDELDKLDRDRQKLGLSRSEYIRILILENKIDKKSNQEILNSILEIQKLISNLEKINSKIEEDGETDYFLKSMIWTSIKDLDKAINRLDNRLD